MLLRDAFHADGIGSNLLAAEERGDAAAQANGTAASCCSAGLGDVLLQVQCNDGLALIPAGQREFQRLVHAVDHCWVQVAWPVGGQHHCKVPRLVACAEQDGIECAAQALTHALSSPPQEGICLINEQEQPLTAGLCPVKQLVNLSDSLAAQRCHVTTGHDGVVQPRGTRQPLCCHGLTRAGRPIEHHVTEGGAVLPRVGCDGCQGTHIVMQGLGQHHIAEVALHRLQRLAAGAGVLAAAPALPRSLTNQAGRAKPALKSAAGDADALAGGVHAQGQQCEPRHC
mmetsp:Transcript_18877/g.57051  ORF Transcript_18877/g.57051 Transcript_18877/m.57051 type:complete len:284 (+) Transcript_18877:2669-3520(+)